MAAQLSVTLLSAHPRPRPRRRRRRAALLRAGLGRRAPSRHDRRRGRQARAHPRALGSPLGPRARLVQLRRRRRLARLHAPAGAPPRRLLQPAVAALRQLLGGDSFVVPPSIAADAEAEAVFLKAMDDARAAYDRLVELGLAEGRSKESVQEDARFVLPNAAETKIVVTMNARELRHFFQVRCCNRAQWEINDLAWEMRGIVTRGLPVPLRGQRSRLPLRHLPRGQDDLRPAVRGRRGRRPRRGAPETRARRRRCPEAMPRSVSDSSRCSSAGPAARKAQVGGQAVLEGVMMRGVDNWSLAVRKPDGDIWLDFAARLLMKKHRFYRLPVVRGVVALVESLIIGVRAIQMSANESLGEETRRRALQEGARRHARRRLRVRRRPLLPRAALPHRPVRPLARRRLRSSGSSRASCAWRSSSSTSSSSRASPTCAACSSTTAPST